MNKELGKAIAFASEVHKNHIDRGGSPYILHPLRVMQNALTKSNNDYRAGIVAICHDTIEDGWPNDFEAGLKVFKYTVLNGVEDKNTVDEITTALLYLTHNKEEEYIQYIKRIGKNQIATLVKICDLEDNSNIMRLKGLREKDFERLKKYHVSHCYLTGKTDKLLDLA